MTQEDLENKVKQMLEQEMMQRRSTEETSHQDKKLKRQIKVLQDKEYQLCSIALELELKGH